MPEENGALHAIDHRERVELRAELRAELKARHAQLDEYASERPAVAREAPSSAKDHLGGAVLPRVDNGRLDRVLRIKGSAAKVDELRTRAHGAKGDAQ